MGRSEHLQDAKRMTLPRSRMSMKRSEHLQDAKRKAILADAFARAEREEA